MCAAPRWIIWETRKQQRFRGKYLKYSVTYYRITRRTLTGRSAAPRVWNHHGNRPRFHPFLQICHVRVFRARGRLEPSGQKVSHQLQRVRCRGHRPLGAGNSSNSEANHQQVHCFEPSKTSRDCGCHEMGIDLDPLSAGMPGGKICHHYVDIKKKRSTNKKLLEFQLEMRNKFCRFVEILCLGFQCT